MPTSKVTISLPDELLKVADRARKQRHCSRSELIREALRIHLLPPYTPTEAEQRAINQGKRAAEEGEVFDWRDIEHEFPDD